MLRRNHIQPEGFEEETLEGFFMIAKSDAALAITQKLTGSQLRLWIYLMMVDPFADCTPDGEPIYRHIPDPGEIAARIGVSRRTVEKDLNVLRELDLYEYKVVEWWGHNKSAQKAKEASERLKCKHGKGGYLTAKTAKQPEPALNNRTGENLTAIPAKKSSANNIDRARDQTYSDLDQTYTDNAPPEPGAPPTQDVCVEKESLQPEPEAIAQSSSPLPEEPEAIAENEDALEIKNSASLPLRDNSHTNASQYITSSAAKQDAVFHREKIDPWLNGRGLNDWKPEFVEYYRQYLSSTPRYLQVLCQQASPGDAKNSLIGLTQTDEGRFKIQNHWDNYQALLQPQFVVSQPQAVPDTLYQPRKLIKLSGKR